MKTSRKTEPCRQVLSERVSKCFEGQNEKIEQLQTEIDNARIGSFDFTIRKEETLQEGMARNYNEFNEERSRLQKENEKIRNQWHIDLNNKVAAERKNKQLREAMQRIIALYNRDKERGCFASSQDFQYGILVGKKEAAAIAEQASSKVKCLKRRRIDSNDG